MFYFWWDYDFILVWLFWKVSRYFPLLALLLRFYSNFDSIWMSSHGMDGSRPFTACSRQILDDCRWFRVVVLGLVWLLMFLGGWFWMVVDGFGCLQIVLRGFKWLSMIYNFTSYGDICCFKFKRSKQLWGAFLISSNKTLRFP